MKRVPWGWLFGVLIGLGGCASTPIGNRELLGFLADGTTTREEIFLHLAEPSASFEGGKILTYRLDEDDSGFVLLKKAGKGWTGKFSLVLVFDERGVLRRHALVRIKEEFQP